MLEMCRKWRPPETEEEKLAKKQRAHEAKKRKKNKESEAQVKDEKPEQWHARFFDLHWWMCPSWTTLQFIFHSALRLCGPSLDTLWDGFWQCHTWDPSFSFDAEWLFVWLAKGAKWIACLLAWFFWIGQLVTIIACKYMLAWCMIKKIKHQFDKGWVLCIALCRHRLGCWNEWRNHPSSRPVIFFWNGLVVFSFLKWSAGQPSRPQPALDDCQQKLLEELLQHFETGVLWLQVWYYFLFRCLVIYTSNILRLMVQGRVLWFQWSLQLGAWHIYIYLIRSCVSAARLTTGLRLPDGRRGLNQFALSIGLLYTFKCMYMVICHYAIEKIRSSMVALPNCKLEQPCTLGKKFTPSHSDLGHVVDGDPWFGDVSCEGSQQYIYCTLACIASECMVDLYLPENECKFSLQRVAVWNGLVSGASSILDIVWTCSAKPCCFPTAWTSSLDIAVSSSRRWRTRSQPSSSLSGSIPAVAGSERSYLQIPTLALFVPRGKICNVWWCWNTWESQSLHGKRLAGPVWEWLGGAILCGFLNVGIHLWWHSCCLDRHVNLCPWLCRFLCQVDPNNAYMSRFAGSKEIGRGSVPWQQMICEL